ncbi:MAG: hypothetical protein K8S23_00705 [Candidatus Cloacimonetes bacterium]|nr:hypothetical protein [Candidatus Cloacimonadota bacterium]
MAKIVYGLSGEGSGHSFRAQVMIKFLLEKGHEVKVTSYDKGYENLKNKFDVLKIEGLRFIIEDNRISKHKTIAENWSTISQRYASSQILKQKLFKEFKPDCVITDFEPMTAYFANQYDIPLITIDNQHRMRYMKIHYPTELLADAILTENLIRLMIPRPDISLISTFYFTELRNDRNFLFPAIISSEIQEITPEIKDHILVYLTAGFESLLEKLKNYKREKFIVYGYDKDFQDDNLHFNKAGRENFLRDLATSKAVFGTAGFTLMTEAFYLKKPYCAFPLKGQFEQIFNGFLLEKVGYGRTVKNLEIDIISSFLYNIPEFQEKFKNVKQEGNSAIFEKLSEILADDCRILKQYNEKRKSIFA